MLKGESTVYSKIDSELRKEFLDIADDAEYYYGHGKVICKDGDDINLLLSDQVIEKGKIGYGNVHLASKNGAMHASPKESVEGRMLILTTIIKR